MILNGVTVDKSYHQNGSLGTYKGIPISSDVTQNEEMISRMKNYSLYEIRFDCLIFNVTTHVD